MTLCDSLEEREGLDSSDLSDDDDVRTLSERRPQQVEEGDLACHAAAPRDRLDPVLVGEVELRGVLYADYLLVGGMNMDRAFKVVVLPLAVPPATRSDMRLSMRYQR